MKNSKNWLVGLLVALVMMCGVGKAEANLISDTWNTSSYGANFGTDQITLNDDADLYQDISVVAGNWYTFSFDFKSDIFQYNDPSAWDFRDLFSATIYFGNSTYAGLLDVTTINDWTPFTYSFQALDSLLTPDFALINNGDAGDSFVYLKNISLDKSPAPVPEPSTLLLLAGGGALLFFRRIRHAVSGINWS